MILFFKKTILFSIFFSSFLLVNSQTKIDSLYNELQNAKHDSIRGKIFSKIGFEHQKLKPDSAIYYYNEAVKILETGSQQKELVAALVNLGKSYGKVGYLDKSLEFTERALVEATKINDSTSIANSLKNIGIINYYQGDFVAAMFYYHKSLDINKLMNDKNGIAQSLNNIGVLYDLQGIYDTAIVFYDEAIVLFLESNDSTSAASVYVNLGSIFSEKGNYNKAFNMYENAIAIYVKSGNVNEEAICYRAIAMLYIAKSSYIKALENIQRATAKYESINSLKGVAYCYGIIGEIQEIQGSYNEAISYYKKALEINKEVGDINEMAYSFRNIANGFQALGNNNLAVQNFEESLKLFKQINLKVGMAKCYLDLGVLFQRQNLIQKALKYKIMALNLFNELDNKKEIAIVSGSLSSSYIDMYKFEGALEYLNKAKKHALKSLSIAREFELPSEEMEALKYLSLIYEESNKMSKALECYKSYTSIKDTLFNKEKQKTLSELEIKYQTKQKEHEISILNQKNLENELIINKEKLQKARSLSLLILISILALIIILSLIYRSQKRKRLVKEKEEKLIQDAKIEIEQITKDKNAELIKSLDREMKNISQEIHDGILSDLTGIQFLIKNKEKKSKDLKINKASDYLKKSIDKLRNISHQLNTPEFEYNTLEIAIESYLEQYKSGELNIDFNYNLTNNIDDLMQVSIYRIIQEGVKNIFKHSNGSNCDVLLEDKKEYVRLLIKDNGISDKINKNGLGLSNIEERVRSMNGRMQINNSNGFEINIELPLVG
ncbi:MAG: tetratricopeptide repeat protein [Salinivirgaceae bacterium]|nr:tetratricopeptide repeat protein [Salinivirgaceae bacterium]